MYKYFPTLTERPELNHSIAALIYQLVAYYSIPFMLLLLLQGSQENWNRVAAGVEIAFHVFNCFVAFFIFREYLSDAALSLKQDLKRSMGTIWLSVGLIFIVALVFYNLFAYSYSRWDLSAHGALPLTEVELFILSRDVVLIYPIQGNLSYLYPHRHPCHRKFLRLCPDTALCLPGQILKYIETHPIREFKFANGVLLYLRRIWNIPAVRPPEAAMVSRSKGARTIPGSPAKRIPLPRLYT